MELSPLIHLVIILLSGGLIWFSGTKLALYSDWISDRFQIGRAFIGAFLLAISTSLPELATTITASWIGNAPLAINNLLGGINLQTVVIAVADLILIRGSLTYYTPKASLLVGGLFVILELAVLAVAMIFDEVVTFYHIGLWPFVLFFLYLLMLYFISRHENDLRWAPKNAKIKKEMKLPTPPKRDFTNARLFLSFAANTIVVLVAGWSIAYFADKLAIQWNWSGSWMGATLVALTTSLPEVSTTFGAVRQKAYVLAISNIFGSNVFTVSLLLPADLFFRKGPIIKQANPSNFLLIGVGIIITSIFLWGILERKNRTFLRMGYDSFFVLGVYLFSLYLLYRIS